MSDTSQGEGWWLASDGRWYPPQSAASPPPPPPLPPPLPPSGPPGAPFYQAAPTYQGGYLTYGAGPPSGPLGQREKIGIQVLLSIVTFGLYGIYWAYKSHDEIQRYTGEGVGGVVGAIIYFFVGLVTLFLLPIEIKKMYEREGRQSPVSAATAFWILLFAIPWYVKCQRALNDFWALKGAPPP